METTYQRTHNVTLNSKEAFPLLNQPRFHRRYKFDSTYENLAGLTRSKTALWSFDVKSQPSAVRTSCSATTRSSLNGAESVQSSPRHVPTPPELAKDGQVEHTVDRLVIDSGGEPPISAEPSNDTVEMAEPVKPVVEEEQPATTNNKPASPRAESVRSQKTLSARSSKPPFVKFEPKRMVRTAEFRSREYPSKVEYKKKIADAQCKAMADGQRQCTREMCYLCTQRAERNVPVYTRALEERADREAAKALVNAEQRRAEAQIQAESDLRTEKRVLSKEVSAVNLSIAQATKERRAEEAKHNLPHESYVMHERPITPHRSVGQKHMQKELSEQIDGQNRSQAKVEADKRLIERLYQIQLAEELSREREKFLAEKKATRKQIRDTFEFQIKSREPELPKSYRDNQVFGKNDVTSEKRQKMRERNRLYASDQFLTFKRNLTARDQFQKSRRQAEADMLRRTKTDLDEDTLKRTTYKQHVRRDLERKWLQQHTFKREKELSETIGIPEKITVQEQLDQYRRCGQCQRKPQNRGETNIWKESYYVPGSRIMV